MKGRPPLRIATLVFCFLCVIRTALAANEGHPKIISVLEHANAGFLPRLRGELSSAGFDLVVVSPPSWPPTRQEIERLTREEGALAGISLVQAGMVVEMWVVDRVTSKTVYREVIGVTDDHRDDSIALRFVETLRATLMEVEQPRSPVGEVSAPPEVQVLLTRTTHHFAFGIGGGAGYSAGGIGTTGHVGLSLTGMLSPRLGLALDGSMTPGRAKVQSSEGQASIGIFLVGASFRFVPVARGPVRLLLGGGAWACVMTMSGEAVAPYVSTRATSTSVLPHLDVGTLLSLTQRLSLGASLSAAISAPALAVRFDERQVATWGRPLWLGSLLVETTLD